MINKNIDKIIKTIDNHGVVIMNLEGFNFIFLNIPDTLTCNVKEKKFIDDMLDILQQLKNYIETNNTFYDMFILYKDNNNNYNMTIDIKNQKNIDRFLQKNNLKLVNRFRNKKAVIKYYE